MALLDRAAVAYQMVLAKADAVEPAALARKQPAAHMEMAVTSAESGLGIAELRAG
jgi:GTP-binding protein